MRIPIAVQLALLVLLTTLLGITVLAVATVRMPRRKMIGEIAKLTLYRVVDHHLWLCNRCRVRIACSLSHAHATIQRLLTMP